MINKKLFIILTVAFILRIISINQSLWLDEGTTSKVVLNYRFTQIISGFSLSDFHPPLYYLFMKLWTNIVGYSEVALRLPSILFSLLTGYLVYKIAKLFTLNKVEGLNGYIAGIWAAVFFLFNPLIVYYSQEARMYMMTTFLLTCGLFYLLKTITNSRINELKCSIIFGVLVFLSFATFYGSIFLIIPMFLLLLYKRKYKSFLISFSIFTFSFLILLPIFIQQLSHSRESLLAVANWTSVLGTANLKNLLMIPLKFAFGRISFYPKWLYYAMAGIWTVFIWIIIFIGAIKKQKENILLIKYYLLYLLIVPLILGLIFSYVTPLLQYFRFIYLIPIMSILFGLGISDKPKSNRVGWILATGFIVLSLIYLLLPQFHRENWKSLAATLKNRIPVYMIKSSSDALVYYRPDIKIKEIRNLIIRYDRSELLERKIYVIPYTADIYDFDYQTQLLALNYRLQKKHSFHGLMYESWVKQ
jgi:4-amino-4-deoxy-L-arabinose transferase-like glycosyltransferase